MNNHNTYVTIDLDAISQNLQAVSQRTAGQVMAIVKADAYGHGAIQIARLLQGECAFFGVSSMAEALELRYAGIDTPILILGHTPPCAFAQAVQYDVRIALFRYEDAVALSEEAVRQQKQAAVHFAVDTGMSRIGLADTEDSADLCVAMSKLPNLYPEGLFSHFATADCADLSAARAQLQRFEAFDRMLRLRNLHIPIRHMDNSAGLMNFPHRFELVRSGIVTYGMYPSAEVDPQLLPIRPALQWRSRVSHVKTLPAGVPISYGGTFVTQRSTVVATVPVGYADGYRRSLSGKFYVLIHGKRAPILGRICMDQMMVDVSDIPQVQPGDCVTLVGTDGAETITMEAISAAADSFNYEFVCGISRRVPRVYCQDGQPVHEVHYLLDR